MRLTVRLILALTLDDLGIASREWEARKKARGRTARSIARAGQLAAWLAQRNPSASPQQIAKAIGRDHTTVLYALRRVPEILATEPEIARAAERLEERIDRLAMLPEDSVEARALLPQPGRWTDPAEARP
jgi:chromosomal replication initiation ATPase DnaA